jgi:hypothetical protein
MSRVIVSAVFPPIPDRRFDWCAYWDGEEEEGHYGWGTTPEEALADLERLDQERAEADDPEWSQHDDDAMQR